MKLYKLFFFCLFFISNTLFCQDTFSPLDLDYHHLIDRFEISSGQFDQQNFGAVRPYLRKNIVNLAEKSYKSTETGSENYMLEYLIRDSQEWAKEVDTNSTKKIILPFIYKNKADFYSDNGEDFHFHLNPLLAIEGGNDARAFIRGFEARGVLAKKLGFYASFCENQSIIPEYVREFKESYGSTPGDGRDIASALQNKVDNSFTRGYLSLNTLKDLLTIQLGYDRNFIGNGFRTMMLSDFSSPYYFLKLTAQIKRIKFTTIFSRLIDNQISTNFSQSQEPKFMSTHYLSWNATDKFSIGVFENVNYRNSDKSINLAFLNPLIFFHSLEVSDNSSGNSILGVDFKKIISTKFSLYGQFVFDELSLKNLKSIDYWGNKFAYQMGVKAINLFGIPTLDYQLEFNEVRPYMYSHFKTSTNYTHFSQNLAHPLGANFTEWVQILRFQPLKKLSFVGTFIFAKKGYDFPNTNYGGDPTKIYFSRQEDYGNFIGQGDKKSLQYINFRLNYELIHNLFIEGQFLHRKLGEGSLSITNFYTLGIRWSVSHRQSQFVF